MESLRRRSVETIPHTYFLGSHGTSNRGFRFSSVPERGEHANGFEGLYRNFQIQFLLFLEMIGNKA
ncbi:hypothetical protein X777_02782 [Ooceraea biroi]|uniref:Uncharacterized protein n=1 Tax=Ooceraea biroi TaxID=2015173 RepID=A0A026WMP3_OOCBI|nr:hypothetical protein X777_02782 [Ooceraea biroi]